MSASLERAAARTRCEDIFVLHKVGDDQIVHIDGWGKGSGWAGNVTLQRSHEPLLADLYTGAVRLRASTPQRIFGPYWTREAAIVAAGDYVIVFGGDDLAPDDDDLHLAAADAAWGVAEVSPAKRLADRLELANAELAITRLPRTSVPALAVGLATSAARSLNASWSAVRLRGAFDGLYFGETPWHPAGSDEEIRKAIDHIPVPIGGGPQVANDLETDPTALPPLSFADGVVSRSVVGLGRGSRLGLLVVVHSTHSPRGFTDLCCELCEAIGSAGTTALENALREVDARSHGGRASPASQATSG